jgi:hypothetical protein
MLSNFLNGSIFGLDGLEVELPVCSKGESKFALFYVINAFSPERGAS